MRSRKPFRNGYRRSVQMYFSQHFARFTDPSRASRYPVRVAAGLPKAVCAIGL